MRRSSNSSFCCCQYVLFNICYCSSICPPVLCVVNMSYCSSICPLVLSGVNMSYCSSILPVLFGVNMSYCSSILPVLFGVNMSYCSSILPVLFLLFFSPHVVHVGTCLLFHFPDLCYVLYVTQVTFFVYIIMMWNFNLLELVPSLWTLRIRNLFLSA